MNNVLVVSVNWLGDVVFSTPVYQNLKANFPGVRITALAVPRVQPVLALCPQVDEVIVYDEDGADRFLPGKLRLIARLRQHRFDAVFFLRPSFSRVSLAFLAGIPVRVGFNTRNFLGLINRPVSPDGVDQMHRLDGYLALLARFGLTIQERTCLLAPDNDSRLKTQKLLLSKGIRENEDFYVLNTGGNWDLKQWPEECFAELASRISREKGLKVVLTGAAGDRDRVMRIAALSGGAPVELAGETDLPGLAAVFLAARGMISADSGPLHLASALGVRSVGIFGPTRPEITGPRGRGESVVLIRDVACNKAPCYYLECPENRCMKAVEVDDVIKVL
ncbi:MAG: lipopolysaccharide heptosyltransferase II [Candidatus Omnitrophica bacterium]|nr:lipopolysaccharide heptosyltransferase II [Candidatus Omnitrophota bacterium]